MSETKPLNEIMRSEFVLAKRWFGAATVAQWLIAIVAVYAISTNKSNATFVVTVAFLGPLLALVFLELGKHFYSKGERIRRLYMLQEGLGFEPSDTDMLDILSQEASPQESEPRPIGTYYAPVGVGASRLLHQLQESSFWTKALARRTMQIHYVIATVGIVATCMIAFFVIRADSQAIATSPVDYSKLFATLLLFFVAGSTMASARSYHALAQTAGHVTEQASVLRKSPDVTWIAIYRVLSAYDTALAKAPPLPSYVYKTMQEKLQAAWDATRQ